ncbi:hypothetical protein JSR06_00595 [Candidatus Vidania fulgoroideae]|uniref:Uncharacterized protein n=1 Tax=Candidatus Vidania fulgoroideorum TaxID=881286 RepID=A0A974X7E0_9PROT|nr:hypothetical protein JSR06_00595 [Candidatus Vidania fulgoroideae]
MKISIKGNIIRLCNNTILLNTVIIDILKKKLDIRRHITINTRNPAVITSEIKTSRDTLVFINTIGAKYNNKALRKMLIKNNMFLLNISKKEINVRLENSNVLEFLGYKKDTIKNINIPETLYLFNISKGKLLSKNIKKLLTKSRSNNLRYISTNMPYHIKIKYLSKLNV